MNGLLPAVRPTTRTNCSRRCVSALEVMSRKLLLTNMTNNNHSDTLVFFGATGDLAYKKIFPALQAMVKRGTLNVPVIGVAKTGWNLDQLKARAKESVEKHGGLDPAAFNRLCA